MNSTREQLLEELLVQVQLLLLVAMNEPVSESLADAMGKVSLTCKALYDQRTANIKGRNREGYAIGHSRNCRINNGMDQDCNCGLRAKCENE